MRRVFLFSIFPPRLARRAPSRSASNRRISTDKYAAARKPYVLSNRHATIEERSNAYMNMGNAYTNKGDFERAMPEYEKALRVRPTCEAAGIQLLDSDPGLAGAIWYPCAGEPNGVLLGDLTVLPDDIWFTGVKDCPVTGATFSQVWADGSSQIMTLQRRRPMLALSSWS